MAEFTLPGKIITGGHALTEAAPLLRELGGKALIVTGKHVGTSSMMEELQDTLKAEGIDFAVFDGITGEPTDLMVEEGVRMYRESACDFCIGLGGGSPLDSAKAIAAMTAAPGKITDYNGKSLNAPHPPVAAIPTTAGTGSEATKFAVITDTQKDVKMLLKGDKLLPDLSIIDYRFSLSCSRSITASSGLDALTHAVEAYTSVKAQPLSDVYALSAVRRILRWLPEAWMDGSSQEARREMALASLEAGICINNSSVTIVHGMSRPIGALFHIPHGLSNAMLMNVCLQAVAGGALERFAALGRAVGAACDADADGKAAGEFLRRLKDICAICQIPSFREYGIEKEAYLGAIEKMAEDAMASGSPENCRKYVTREEIMELYQKAYGE